MTWDTHFYNRDTWNKEISNFEEKSAIAQKLAMRLTNDDIVGAGSGSTCFLTLQAIADRCEAENINVTLIPTSREIEMVCAFLNLPMASLLEKRPDWCFDGADEIDSDLRLIKGRGGALFREKLIMSAAKQAVIIADKTKLVEKLGQKFPIPVEVVPDALNLVKEQLEDLLSPKAIHLRLAEKKDGPVVTENGNFLLDISLDTIEKGTEKIIKSIVGVVESGLFEGYNPEIVSG